MIENSAQRGRSNRSASLAILSNEASAVRLDADAVVDRVLKTLLAAKVTLGCVDGDVAKQKLDPVPGGTIFSRWRLRALRWAYERTLPLSRDPAWQESVQTSAQPFGPELQDRHRRDHPQPRAHRVVRPSFSRHLSPPGE